MPAEFIYTTYRLARHYPPDRTVLEDISLSFYPGAKIGVIGPNGAGKSSLLRIMAGLDDGFTGDARLTPGFTVGYLDQEPQLDATKDVKGNVLDGVRPVQDLIDQYNAVMAKWSDPGWISFHTEQGFRDLLLGAGFARVRWQELLPGFALVLAQRGS